ncbi:MULTISPECIES: hypothetical protein [unclassified Arthrobacter]|uniref:hypothetical protein n=1 Tax=unclassified Arthrobacter TaxID=235627 RepID=UPI00288314B5|nr:MULTISPECIES: hypothetical protein [unclassified Arthrobacter]
MPVDFEIAFTATTRAGMERKLDAAHEKATKRALLLGKQGIIITRHSDYDFTVALTDSVPFGTTRERYAQESGAPRDD